MVFVINIIILKLIYMHKKTPVKVFFYKFSSVLIQISSSKLLKAILS